MSENKIPTQGDVVRWARLGISPRAIAAKCGMHLTNYQVVVDGNSELRLCNRASLRGVGD
jgi:hypothetical protein